MKCSDIVEEAFSKHLPDDLIIWNLYETPEMNLFYLSEFIEYRDSKVVRKTELFKRTVRLQNIRYQIFQYILKAMNERSRYEFQPEDILHVLNINLTKPNQIKQWTRQIQL